MKKMYLLASVYLFSITVLICNDSWTYVQKNAQNAAVQILTIKKNFSWFNPYMSVQPNHYTGSGFFINGEGDIITNSHVVDTASAVYIRMPVLGQQRLAVEVVSICPQHDLALLRLTQESKDIVLRELSEITYLSFGDSNDVCRCDEVVALGFPLNSQNLKSTIGIISGHSTVRIGRMFFGGCLQIDTPINPGNSGGPLLNKKGEVVGIIKASNDNAQNYNFAIPVNNLKIILSDLYDYPLLTINEIGLTWSCGTDEVRDYYGNPLSYGCYICSVERDSGAEEAGLQPGDMLYEIDGYVIDSYGEIKNTVDNDRIAFSDYMMQMPLASEFSLLVYRNGEPFNCTLRRSEKSSSNIQFKYPAYQTVDYEVFGGLIVMELTVNYIEACANERPGLQRYLTNLYKKQSRLVVANILAGSRVDIHMRTINCADTINEVNEQEVHTLADFRKALLKSIDTGKVILKTTDEWSLNTDNVMTVLLLDESCRETVALSKMHQYPLSDTVKKLIAHVDSSLL